MAGRFLTLEEVADELAVTRSQVYTMVRDGELPAIKIGRKGHWRVERSRLEEYITARYAETDAYVRSNPLTEPPEA
jgi:excisionase family DNA binding protein